MLSAAALGGALHIGITTSAGLLHSLPALTIAMHSLNASKRGSALPYAVHSTFREINHRADADAGFPQFLRVQAWA